MLNRAFYVCKGVSSYLNQSRLFVHTSKKDLHNPTYNLWWQCGHIHLWISWDLYCLWLVYGMNVMRQCCWYGSNAPGMWQVLFAVVIMSACVCCRYVLSLSLLKVSSFTSSKMTRLYRTDFIVTTFADLLKEPIQMMCEVIVQCALCNRILITRLMSECWVVQSPENQIPWHVLGSASVLLLFFTASTRVVELTVLCYRSYNGSLGGEGGKGQVRPR